MKYLPIPPELVDVLEVEPVLELGKQSGLVWTKRVARRIKEGDVAGRLGVTAKGRKDWQLMYKNKNYLVSRLVWFLSTGEDPKEKTIDHIDKNSLNNNVSNLRLADVKLQNNNKNKRRNNKSGAVGVSFHSQVKKWRADIRVENKTKYLGCFECKLAAASAYNKAVLLYVPEYSSCKLNGLDKITCGCPCCGK